VGLADPAHRKRIFRRLSDLVSPPLMAQWSKCLPSAPADGHRIGAGRRGTGVRLQAGPRRAL